MIIWNYIIIDDYIELYNNRYVHDTAQQMQTRSGKINA